jgi:hypothetical protein
MLKIAPVTIMFLDLALQGVADLLIRHAEARCAACCAWPAGAGP